MTNAISFQIDADKIVTLTIDMPGQSANTMNAAYREAMGETINRLEADKADIAGVILTSGKSTFFAGGDLNELVQAQPEHAEPFFQMVETIKGQLRRLEKLGKPVVAAINGAALGGGFEIALACQRRICLSNSKIQLGLPEVTLGLLPGGGGVTRLVRLLGLQAAFPFLMEGKRVRPQAALEAGLIHELADTPEEMLAKARAWILANPNAKQPWDADGYKMPGGTPSSPKVAQMLAIAPAMLRAKTSGCYPAPEAIMSAAVEGAQVDFDTASRIESRYFVKLATGQIAKNMIGSFWFQLNEIKAGGSRPKDIAKSKVSKVAVIGAGMMGAGIAWATASKGIPVVLKDVSQEAADKGKAYSKKLLDKKVSRGQMAQSKADEILGLIHATTDAADFAGCDLVIEAVFENRELKAKVTQEAEKYLAPNALVASNTSTLPITGLAQASANPANFIGLHFFSPVDKMELVEIIKGKDTTPETLARAFDYVLQIGKTPIVVNDSRGFFTSRVFGTYVNEGIAMLGEGVYPWGIEMAAAKAGMPVGPLAVTDEVSLSLCQHIRDQSRADMEAEGKPWQAHPAEAVIDQMLGEYKRAGKAAGAGFYDYPAGGKKQLWPGLAEHYVKPEKQIQFRDMRDRLLFIQAIETVRCFEEGVLESVRDANIGSIFGLGFAPWSGGAIQYINQYGVAQFVERAKVLAKRYGARFNPPQLLLDKAAKGEQFI